MPVYFGFFLIAMLASIGLAVLLLHGIIGQFLVGSAAFQASHIYGILGRDGLDLDRALHALDVPARVSRHF